MILKGIVFNLAYYNDRMKFIADAMLGRLAKWLRILGFDVLYYPVIDDRKIVRISREEGRIVLTRDNALIRRKGLEYYIFIKSDNIFNQLLEIRDRLVFKEAAPSGRCSVCNGILSKVSTKRAIKESVPDFIYHNFNEFRQCSDCGKVYWEGTHKKKIRENILKILSASSDSLREEGRL